MKLCARCDWQPDPEDERPAREQLAEHAQDALHWLCRVCGWSLGQYEPVIVCERCLAQAQANLASVLELWAELPGVLGRPAGSSAYDVQRGGGEEFTLPGGEALVLSGPGSYLAHCAESDSRAGDDLPPAVVLHQWAMDWHDYRGELYPHNERTTSRRAGRWAARYLETHARWAASNHDAFDEFCGDLAALVGRLARTTGHLRQERVAAAACFDCGGQLVHRVINGLEEEGVVRCRKCGQVYTGARYLLALAAQAKSGLDGWVTLKAAALACGRPERTLRSEVERQVVPSACWIEERTPTEEDPRRWRMRALTVWYPAIEERARRAAERRRVAS